MNTYTKMPKYLNTLLALVAVLFVTTTSCKKSFLEIVPKGLVVAKTYDDYNLFMNNSSFYQFSSGAWQGAMLMGDEVAGETTYFNSASVESKALFRWQDVVYQPASKPLELSNFSVNIFSANIIIAKIMGVEGGTEQKKKQLMAEARAVRAFNFYQQLNQYAKPYNASTAATDLGFPIILDADVSKNDFDRSTVQVCYDFVISEFQAAIADLPVQQPVATRMSRPGVKGLLGKVFLSMGRTTEALAMFNGAFADIATMTVPPRLYDYNVTLGTNGSFLPITTTSGPSGSPFRNQVDLTESITAVMFSNVIVGFGYGADYLVLTTQAAALYGPTDLRLRFYSNLQQSGTANPGGRLRKYGVRYIRFGMELPDLYLLRAEARARLNDLVGAKADLEALRNKRMPDGTVPSAIAADQTSLIKFIIDERIREFAATGYRWFDMRRLANDPIFSSQPAAVHLLYTNGVEVERNTLRPERLTLRLPQAYLDANPGMPDNP